MERLLLVLGLVASPLVAQGPDPAPARMSNFPYLVSTPNDGLLFAFRVIRYRQAAFDARVTNLREHSVDVGYSARTSYFVRGEYRRLWLEEGWRVDGVVEASREVRFGESDQPALPDIDSPSLRRTRQQGWLDVTRRVHGPWHVALRGLIDRQELLGDQTTLFARYPQAPSDGIIVCVTAPCPGFPVGITQTDAQLRAALVLDSRDNEYNPNRGVLAEVGLFTGSGGAGYRGAYGLASGWVSPRRGTRLTARYAFRALSSATAIGIQQELPAWEAPFTTLGGPRSHRGLPVGALTGRGVLLGGVELRHDLLDFGGLGAITLLAFVDGGRAFQDPSPLVDPAPGSDVPRGKLEFTFRDWTWGAGGGLGLRVLRAAQLNVTAAKARGETRWYVSSGWSW